MLEVKLEPDDYAENLTANQELLASKTDTQTDYTIDLDTPNNKSVEQNCSERNSPVLNIPQRLHLENRNSYVVPRSTGDKNLQPEFPSDPTCKTCHSFF